MKGGNKFLLLVPVLIFILVIAGYLLYRAETISRQDWMALILAYALTTLNYFLGLLSFRLGINASDSRFVGFVAGGILIRLILLLGLTSIVLILLQIKVEVFIFIIFIFYTLYLITEILYFYSFKGKTH